MLVTMKRFFYGWLERVAQSFFSSPIGEKITSRYGFFFDPSLQLEEMSSKLPEKATYFALTDEKRYCFEIVGIDEEEDTIIMRELSTGTEHDIRLALFDMIFIETTKPIGV